MRCDCAWCRNVSILVQHRLEPKLNGSADSGRGGSRHLSLNDYLCKKVWLYFPHDWNGFLAEAHAWNESAARERIGKELLDDQGIMRMVLALRLEHSARCEREETFAICPFSMARDEVIPGWTRERYENARDLLLEAGLITCVSEYERGWKTGRSARYLLG